MGVGGVYLCVCVLKAGVWMCAGKAGLQHYGAGEEEEEGS